MNAVEFSLDGRKTFEVKYRAHLETAENTANPITSIDKIKCNRIVTFNRSDCNYYFTINQGFKKMKHYSGLNNVNLTAIQVNSDNNLSPIGFWDSEELIFQLHLNIRCF